MRSWWKKEKCLRDSERLLRLGQYDAALTALAPALASNAHRDLRIQEVWILKEAGRLDHARTAAQAMADEDPQDPIPFLLLGEIALLQKDYRSSIQSLERSLELGGENLHADYLLGRACLGLGDFDRASRHFEGVVRYDPTLVRSRLLAMSELFLMERR